MGDLYWIKLPKYEIYWQRIKNQINNKNKNYFTQNLTNTCANINLHHTRYTSNQKIWNINNLLRLVETLMLTVSLSVTWKTVISGPRMNLKNESNFESNSLTHSQTYPKCIIIWNPIIFSASYSKWPQRQSTVYNHL